jgi:class 3 adenylate cyclase
MPEWRDEARGPPRNLPTGTVTFLFTDIEGSTNLVQELGEDYGPVQGDHHRILREAIAEGGGNEVGTEGDSFFATFTTPAGALRTAVRAQRELATHPWTHGRPLRVRMGLHTGEGRLRGGEYVGIVNRAARIAAAGHGGHAGHDESADHQQGAVLCGKVGRRDESGRVRVRAARRTRGRRGPVGASWPSRAPGRTRTSDTRFRKPVLCPMSYGAGVAEMVAENPF